MVTIGILENDYHFKIWCTDKLNTDKYNITTMKTIIAVDMKVAIPEYSKHCRNTGTKPLPSSTLDYYLKNINEFFGMANCRFKQSSKNLNDKSATVLNSGYGNDGETKYSSIQKWCHHFEYTKLNINIETDFSDM